MKLLDAGCGPGGIVNISLYEKFAKDYQIYGIDFLKKNIQSISFRFPHGIFQVADVQKIPFNNNTFDAVMLRHVLEHVSDVDAVLEEVKRISKNNTKVFIALPHPGFEKLLHFIDPHHSTLGHKRILKQMEAKEILQKHGFTIKKIQSDYWPLFVIDMVLGTIAKFTKDIRLGEQTGMYAVGKYSYTKKVKSKMFYSALGSLINFLNKIYFLNYLFPFEIAIEAQIKK